MRTVTDEAVIIGLRDYRETDRIVTLYAREHGRFSGVARGARRSVKRFGGALELFARLTVDFVPGEGLAAIRDVDIESIFPQIRATLAGIAHAGYACELVAAMAPEGYANQRLFRLLTSYLEHLDKGEFHPSDRHFFEMNLLNILGYRPPLENCSVCGCSLGGAGGVWTEGGEAGLRCTGCGRSGLRLAGSAVTTLLQSLKTGRFGQVRLDPVDLAAAENFLAAFIAANLHHSLKSLAFLRLSP